MMEEPLEYTENINQINTIELCGLAHHRYRTFISFERFKSEIRFLTCQKHFLKSL